MTFAPSLSPGFCLRPLAALLLGSLCAAASADAVTYQFNDDKNSANYYQRRPASR